MSKFGNIALLLLSSGIKCIPLSTASLIFLYSDFLPLINISPLIGFLIENNVSPNSLLPAPINPAIAVISPLYNFKLRG